MGILRNPETGKAAMRLRVWFETKGSSPQRPYAVRRRYEDRYVAVPQEMLDDDDQTMAICTDQGETWEPWCKGSEPRADGEGDGAISS